MFCANLCEEARENLPKAYHSDSYIQSTVVHSYRCNYHQCWYSYHYANKGQQDIHLYLKYNKQFPAQYNVSVRLINDKETKTVSVKIQ